MHTQKLELSKIKLVCFSINESKDLPISSIIKNALDEATILSVNDISGFEEEIFEVTSQPYNSGYIEERYMIEITNKNKVKILSLLLSCISINLDTDIFVWELYKNNTLLIACNIIQDHITFNESIMP